MEEDLKIYSKLSKRQYGFTKGASTETALDADTLREITQKSLNSIDEWCKENGLKISALKTHSVMFTWKRKWKFSVPLKIDNQGRIFNISLGGVWTNHGGV